MTVCILIVLGIDTTLLTGLIALWLTTCLNWEDA